MHFAPLKDAILRRGGHCKEPRNRCGVNVGTNNLYLLRFSRYNKIELKPVVASVRRRELAMAGHINFDSM